MLHYTHKRNTKCVNRQPLRYSGRAGYDMGMCSEGRFRGPELLKTSKNIVASNYGRNVGCESRYQQNLEEQCCVRMCSEEGRFREQEWLKRSWQMCINNFACDFAPKVLYYLIQPKPSRFREQESAKSLQTLWHADMSQGRSSLKLSERPSFSECL